MRYFGCSSARWRASSSRMCSPGGSAFAPCGRPVNPLGLSASADTPVPEEGSLRAMCRVITAGLRCHTCTAPSLLYCQKPASLSKLAPQAKGHSASCSSCFIIFITYLFTEQRLQGGSLLLRRWRHSRLLHPSVARLDAGATGAAGGWGACQACSPLCFRRRR